MVLPPFWKRVYSKRKEFASFSEGAWCAGKQTGSPKSCLPCQKMANVPSSLYTCNMSWCHADRLIWIWKKWDAAVNGELLIFFFFFFFFDLGFTALSRIFHLYRADRSLKVGENRRTRRKTTWPSVSRTWLSHIWPELGSNHSGEKPNGLRVNSLIH